MTKDRRIARDLLNALDGRPGFRADDMNVAEEAVGHIRADAAAEERKRIIRDLKAQGQ